VDYWLSHDRYNKIALLPSCELHKCILDIIAVFTSGHLGSCAHEGIVAFTRWTNSIS
jgi:hypothetical protein